MWRGFLIVVSVVSGMSIHALLVGLLLTGPGRAQAEETPGRIPILGDVGLFSRGDVNGDMIVDLTDSVYLLDYLFKGGPEPVSMTAADANGDGKVDIGDVMEIMAMLFR